MEGGGDEQIRTSTRSSLSPQDQESQLCLHVGQLDVTSQFQDIDGGEVLQAVVVVQQVLTIHCHLEASILTSNAHLDRQTAVSLWSTWRVSTPECRLGSPSPLPAFL